ISAPARVPLSADEPKTLVDVFEFVARQHKRSDTLNYKKGDTWLSISSDELLSRARQISAGLYSLGVRRGDRVALLSESRPEWTLTDAGCIFLGAVDVPIYPTLTPPQVRYILKDSGARVLVLANYEKYDQLAAILKECPNLEHVILFDSKGRNAGPGLSLADVEKKGLELIEKNPAFVEAARVAKPEDLATLIYTSGTTGEPK